MSALLLQNLQNIVDNIFRARRSPQIRSMHPIDTNRLMDRVFDNISVCFVSQMVEQIDGSVQHGHGIRLVLADQLWSGVSRTRLENRVIIAVIDPWGKMIVIFGIFWN